MPTTFSYGVIPAYSPETAIKPIVHFTRRYGSIKPLVGRAN